MKTTSLHEATVDAFSQFTSAQVQVLHALLFDPQHAASAGQLRMLLALKSTVQINNAMGSAARTVFQRLHAHPDGLEEDEFAWWTVLAKGEHINRSGFVWTLRADVVSALMACGLANKGLPGADEVLPGNLLVEGARHQVLVNAYERNPVARARCIEHFGPSCRVCDVNFGKTYGGLAEGFMHVHHLRPLSSIDHKYLLDPISDLRPVCPNCHAVIHLSDPPYTLEQVREFIARQQSSR